MAFNATFNNISVLLWWSILFFTITPKPFLDFVLVIIRYLIHFLIEFIMFYVRWSLLIRIVFLQLYFKHEPFDPRIEISKPHFIIIDNKKQKIWFLIIGVLTPLSTIFQLLSISWRPVLVVEEAGVPGDNHRPWATNW